MPLVPLQFPPWGKNESLSPQQYCRLKEVVSEAIENSHVMSADFEGYVVSSVSAKARQAAHQVAAKYKWRHISHGEGHSRLIELRPPASLPSAATEGMIGADGSELERTRDKFSEAKDGQKSGRKRFRNGKGVGGTPADVEAETAPPPDAKNPRQPRWRKLTPRITISSTSSSGEQDVDENTPFPSGDYGDVPITFRQFFTTTQG